MNKLVRFGKEIKTIHDLKDIVINDLCRDEIIITNIVHEVFPECMPDYDKENYKSYAYFTISILQEFFERLNEDICNDVS